MQTDNPTAECRTELPAARGLHDPCMEHDSYEPALITFADGIQVGAVLERASAMVISIDHIMSMH